MPRDRPGPGLEIGGRFAGTSSGERGARAAVGKDLQSPVETLQSRSLPFLPPPADTSGMAANLKSGALWALLLLPAGLGVGWLVGRIPEPRGSATPSPTRPAAGASLPRPASAPVAEAVRAA